MMKMKGLFAALVMCAVLFSGFASSPVGLKTNHLVEPGHVDGTPVFSWRMAADRPGARQTAYRLKVEDVWDSGVVEDGKSVGIALAGRPLESARRYRWTVAVRDETGAWSESEPATFSTGVLKDGDWGGAQWIAPATAAPHGYRTALFRRAFGVTKSVSEAWWTVTGAGVFVPSVNGRPVTDEALLPGATHALKVRQACTYDVTDLLRKAQGATNVLGATVSTGWSRDRIAARNRSGRGLDPSQPGAFKAVLVLRYGDGSEERLATDESWQATEGGPLVAAGIYEGEEFDARQSVDWAGADWPAARLNADFAGVVRNFRGPPVSLRRDLALKPIAASVVNGAKGAGEKSFGTAQVRRRFADGEPMTLAPGEQLVVDFGQNASAVPEFVLSAAAGTKVEVRHAEMLNEGRGEKARGNDGPAGTPYLSNLRTSFAGIRYTCRGGDRESYRPAFTFFGYRYIGVTADRPLTIWRVTSVPVTSVPQGYDTGTLETDNPRINRLLANCRWGMYSNYLSVPTDCPQRDERVGWTADTQVFTPAATYLADVYAFLSKWMGDMRDCQRADGCFSQIAPENAVRGAVTGWTDAGVIVPYVLWRRSGDAAVVRENWSAMVRYLDYVEKRGAQDAQPYGDWLSYEYGADMEWLKPVREQRQLPRKRVLNAAYRVWIGRMMAEMAEAIGETAAVSKYRAFAERETERFRGTCLKPDGTLLAECDGQCSGLFALYLKLLPDAAAVEATKRDLRENFRRNGDCLRTGFLGTSILLDAVTEGLGDLNLAYALLLQDKNPSWLYSVDQGATTIWERWNSYTKSDGFGPVSMNSFNHYAYGAVAGWMFSTMAGIRAEEPGFRKIRFAPKPDKRIGRVSAAFDSPYGRIRSSWRHEGSRVVWEGEVPPNATAVLESPDGSVRNLESGSHRAEWSVQPAARDFVELGSGRESAAELLKSVEGGALDGAPMKGIVLRIAADATTSADRLSDDVRRLLAGIDARQPWAEALLMPVVAADGRAAALNARLEADLVRWAGNWRRTAVTWVGDAARLDAAKAEVLGAKPRLVSLDGAWRFRREIVVENGVKRTNAAPAWTTVEVPHDWAIRDPFPPDGPSGSGKLSWCGTGRYRRTFELSAAEVAACAKGGRVYLQFDGAMARPGVFVNGRKAGGWDYGYMSFTVNATDFVRAGTNDLEVFCDTRAHRSRWYPGGGLYRSVRLKVMPRDHVVPDSLAITTPVVTKERATVKVSYVSSLRGPDEYEFEVKSPHLWDVDDPHLYTLELLGETFRYGIRTAKFTADDGFHLNGRRVQLKGVNLHADMGPLGMAFNRSAMRRQLAIMKEMGANALRTSHNAPDPQVLDLCDEMGILVWDECFDKWDGTASRYDWESVEEFVGRNLVAFVKRDRNHPSVVAWSQSNEIVPANGASPSGLTRGRCALFRKLMRMEDETRPIGNGNVSHMVFPRLRTTDIHADLDVTGWNYGACYRQIRAKYPGKPLVYTESASAVSSFGGYENPPASGKQDWPATVGDVSAYDHNCGPDIPDVEFDRMEADRSVAGEFVWTGIDYLGEPFPYTSDCIGRLRHLPNAQMARSAYFGICDLNGHPKDRYWLYRSYWKPEAFTLHILPHWNWPGKEGKNVPVYVYTNGDEAELFLNGRSLGRRRKGEIQKADPSLKDFRGNAYYEVCDKYRLRWLDVPYEPGELRVVAYRDGAKLGEKTMKTAGRPVRVQLTPESEALPADGKTVVFCAVDLVDASGVRDPWAKDKVAFRVEGPGELLSVSNGDAREFTSFVNFSGYPLYYGKAFVTLRRKAGETVPIRLVATCGELAPAVAEFR